MDGFVRIAPQLECHGQSEVRALSAYKDVVYFKPEFDNNIYQIKDGKISLRYILNFGSKTVPDLSTIDRDVETGLMLLRMNTVANIYNYIETDKYLLMDFRMNDEYYMGIYNKRKHSTEIASLGYYEDEYIFRFGNIRGMFCFFSADFCKPGIALFQFWSHSSSLLFASLQNALIREAKSQHRSGVP